MKKLFFSLSLLTLLATACKKDKDAPAITMENISGTYKIMSIIRTFSDGSQVDMFENGQECNKEDLEKYETNGNWSYIDAGLACDPAPNGSGTWELRSDTLLVNDYAVIISKFDGSTMETIDEWSGNSVKTTYKKQ